MMKFVVDVLAFYVAVASAVEHVAVASAVESVAVASAVEPCPGEDRMDRKCNHDDTHRVCAKLLDSSGSPLNWGASGDFWKITGQKDFQWDDEIRAAHGDSWCICMWATAELISQVGCDAVHLRCEATDVKYILGQYTDAGVDLAVAKSCLEKKCPGAAHQRGGGARLHSAATLSPA